MGHLWNVGFFSQTYPPKSKFEPERDIPDLTGKVIIVTGGNHGIGKETVRELLNKNAKVYMASRSKERAEAAINELKNETGKEAIFLLLDLGDLDAVRRAADEFKRQETKLDVLFNNAGVIFSPIDQLTTNGYDLQFGTNCLGHAHFTLCLISELIEGAKSSQDSKARVINTSSSGAYMIRSEGIRYDTLQDGPERRKLGPTLLYWQSKYGNAVFSSELAKLYADQGIISNAVNPGNLNTGFMTGFLVYLLSIFVLYPPRLGALTQLWGGTSPETKDYNGEFLIPWARLGTCGEYIKGPGQGQKLWKWIEKQRKGH